MEIVQTVALEKEVFEKEPAVTTSARSNPNESKRMCRFRPLIILPPS
jgi:hypothetical protein